MPPHPIARSASWIASEISSRDLIATHQQQGLAAPDAQSRTIRMIIFLRVEEILWDWIVKIMNCNRAEVGHL